MPTVKAATASDLAPGKVMVGEVEPEDFRRILENWFRQRGDGDVPDQTQIDPFFAPRLAANILLLGVEGDEIRYRIVGEEVHAALGRRIHGLKVADALGESEYARLILAQFVYSVANRCPLYSVHFYRRPGDDYSTRALRILMPYRDETGKVVRLLAYQLFEAPLQGRLPSGDELLELMSRTVFRVVQ